MGDWRRRCDLRLGRLLIVAEPFPAFSAPVRALLLTGLASAFVWVSFGPGERAFTDFLSLPFLSTSDAASGLLSRLGFALGAILLMARAGYFRHQFGRGWLNGDLDD